MQSDGKFMVKLFCVNPAENLQNCLEQGNSTIFFSATLLPIQYYKSLLSVDQDDYAVYAESTFPAENRRVLLTDGVSTKYTSRGEEMYSRIHNISERHWIAEREIIWPFSRHTG